MKKCGHQGGKVLVSQDEQIKRLSAARFQLDVMGVPGIIVARTDAESATLLDGRSDDRDQPFILGATNLSLPTFKAAFLAILRQFRGAGVEELSGHELYALCDEEYAAADAWLERTGFDAGIAAAARRAAKGEIASVDAALDKVFDRFVDAWQQRGRRPHLRRGGGGRDRLPRERGRSARDDARTSGSPSRGARRSTWRARRRARSASTSTWDCEHAKTPDGYYQVRGGIDYAIAKSLAAAPFADLLWMETKTADLADAKRFADAIHAVYPGKMLAYNLSPSFNWDTTGMDDERCAASPRSSGSSDSSSTSSPTGATRSTASPPRSSPRRCARTACSPSRGCSGSSGCSSRATARPRRSWADRAPTPRSCRISGRTATTKAMGQGSTQHQHLVQTEVPPRLLEEWLDAWREHHGVHGKLRVSLKPQSGRVRPPRARALLAGRARRS